MSLRDDILADPACAPALAAKDCNELARIRSIGRTRVVKILIADIQDLLHATGKWWDIADVAADSAHLGNKAARAVVDVATARYDRIDTTIPMVGEMLGALVTTEVMEQALLEQIMAMAIVPDLLTPQQVAEAVFNPDGSLK
jgi:hypothetical protein